MKIIPAYLAACGALHAQAAITALDTAGDVGYTPSIAVGSDGLPIIAYYDYTNRGLKIVKCGNASCSGGNAVTVADTARGIPSISMGTDGMPLIAYYEQTGGNLEVMKCGNASCSSGNIVTVLDTAGIVGAWPSLRVPADGLPVMSYFHYGNYNLKVAKCGNASCTAGNTVTVVDTARLEYDYSSLAIGADGLPVISYRRILRQTVMAAKCGNASCTAGNIITRIDTAAGDLGTSIAVPADGLPVISYYYYAFGTQNLRVTKCGNAACSSGNVFITVDPAAVVGQYSALTIGLDGLPIISYYRSSGGDLKAAKCGNASCSAGNVITNVDTAGNTGRYTSIAIPADGLPVIAYYNATRGDLMVAKCTDAACSGPVSVYRIRAGSPGTGIRTAEPYFRYQGELRDLQGRADARMK